MYRHYVTENHSLQDIVRAQSAGALLVLSPNPGQSGKRVREKRDEQNKQEVLVIHFQS